MNPTGNTEPLGLEQAKYEAVLRITLHDALFKFANDNERETIPKRAFMELIKNYLLPIIDEHCQSHKAKAWEEGFAAAVFTLDNEIPPINPYIKP